MFPFMWCYSVQDVLVYHSVFLSHTWRSSFHPVNDVKIKCLLFLYKAASISYYIWCFQGHDHTCLPWHSCCCCAVPELPVLGSSGCNCECPLLYFPLPSCSHCMALPSHTSTFCEGLISRVHFLMQIVFVEAHMPSIYGCLKLEYQLCSLQNCSQDQLWKKFDYMS